MSFTLHDFREVLDDIEKLFGYLKGAELAEAYMYEVGCTYGGCITGDGEFDPGATENGGLLHVIQWESPCSEERFRMRRAEHVWLPPETDWDRILREINEGLDQAWNNGVSWSAGISGYCQSVAAQISEPVITSLISGITGMQSDVAVQLDLVLGDDWAHLGGLHSLWDGEAGRAFEELYDNYNEYLNLYGQFVCHAALGCALAAAIIARYQNGLMPFVESIRAMLEEWCEIYTYRRPSSGGDWPVWAVKAGAVAKEVFGLVGGKKVSALKEAIGYVESVVNIIQVFDEDAFKSEGQKYDYTSADELYTKVTSTLYDDYLQGMKTDLDGLAAGIPGFQLGGDLGAGTFGSEQIRTLLEGKLKYDWLLPNPGTGNLNTECDPYPVG